MKSIIILKWIEPYKLLETIKENYQYTDYTFDGTTKDIEKKKFFKSLENNPNSVGLYMKNVNKYYLFTKDSEFDIWTTLSEKFSIDNSDIDISKDVNKPFEMVDLGKAEACLILM